MKRLAYIFLAVTAMAGLFSCTDEPTYEPGPQAEGPQYYFSTESPSSVKIGQTTKSVTVDVYRIETASAGSVTVGVADESGLISPSSSATASFNAGSNKATITFPIDPTAFTFAKSYPVTYTLSSDTTPYGKSEMTVSYMYPTPLTSLGKGKLEEGYYWGGSNTPEILQSDLDPNEFHVRGFLNGIASNSSEELIFRILKPGETIGSQTITLENLIWYDDTNSGYHHSTYDADILICHPSGFKATKDDQNMWAKNAVVEYQENGLPGIVTLGSFYYMNGVGGWNGSQTVCITITFPGYEPKDYTVDAEYAGIFKDIEDKVFAEANVTFGADVESGVAILVAGDSQEAIMAGYVALVAGEDESIVPFTGTTVRVPMPEGAETGKYSIVVGCVAEDAVQDGAVTTFFYQAGGEVKFDWDWLVGEWNAQDLEGDPYTMTISKKDETTAIFAGIWDMGPDAIMEGTVDFEAKTVTFKGPIYLGDIAGGKLYIAHYNAEADEYDEGEFTATFASSGITISGQGYYIEGGSYAGGQGGDVTRLTK